MLTQLWGARAAGEAHEPSVFRTHWYAIPIGIFAATRVVCALLLLVIGRSQFDPSTLPVAPGRPGLETGRSYGDLIANWDGQWYRDIAEHGYPHHLPLLHGAVEMNGWAFYPLYPSLVRLVMWTGLPYAAAATFVSLVFGAAGMTLLYRMLAPTLGGFASCMTVLALCVAPAAVLWQAGYTESLALFLILAGLWALRSHRYGTLLAVALALALTRPIVLPLATVAAAHWFVRWRRRAVDPFPRREATTSAAVIAAMAASFLLWPTVAAVVTGRPDAYFVTQRAWLHKTPGWPTWLTGFVGGSELAMTLLVATGCIALIFVVLRKPARLWGSELRAWAILYPLYILGSTRPATSIFRYALLAVVPWWPLPEIGRHVKSLRERLSLAAFVIVLGIGAQIVWMRWYWVVGPYALSFP